MKLVNGQEDPERFQNNPELLIQLAREYDVNLHLQVDNGNTR
jgi:hypothetical protein